MNSSREIVNMALNRKASNAASIPKGWRHDASGQWWKPGRFVAYKGVPYQIVDDSDPDRMKLSPVSGGSIISARDTELDAIVKNENALVIRNTQGDALSSATYAIGKAMNYLRDSVQSLNSYFQYSLGEGASEKDIATDKHLRTEVKQVRSQLIAEISSITALEKTVSKLRGIADGAGF